MIMYSSDHPEIWLIIKSVLKFINNLICSSIFKKNYGGLLGGKSIHSDNVPIDLSCDAMNDYLSNISCELTAKVNNTPATWKGPFSIHTFHFDVFTSESVMKLPLPY